MNFTTMKVTISSVHLAFSLLHPNNNNNIVNFNDNDNDRSP